MPDAFGGDFPFELGKGQEYIESQPAHGGRGIELLGDRDERYAMGIDGVHRILAPPADGRLTTAPSGAAMCCTSGGDLFGLDACELSHERLLSHPARPI